eukprot:TRINITY_DN2744_c0_g1_i3.p1 TRINITY_DN2744_c0_g1~~TRINITY_DN2744_c0_g1_i3.p1  ORF type:complete len:611 (+),score=131.35 TRINITY_DN2744_c0_g1_i3:35-1867(+)
MEETPLASKVEKIDINAIEAVDQETSPNVESSSQHSETADSVPSNTEENVQIVDIKPMVSQLQQKEEDPPSTLTAQISTTQNSSSLAVDSENSASSPHDSQSLPSLEVPSVDIQTTAATSALSPQNPHTPKSVKPPYLGLGECLFEHFLVVGVPQWKCEKLRPNDVVEAEILYKFPANKPLGSDKIASFCFPDSIIISSIKRTPSCSGLNELVFGQSYLYNSHHSYMFRLSGENSVLYGVCITKTEFIEDVPTFFNATNTTEHAFNLRDNRPNYKAAPRCYCIVSAYPHFAFHFEVLRCILGQDRIYRIMKSQTDDESAVLHFSEGLKSIELLRQNYRINTPQPGTKLDFEIPGQHQPKDFIYPSGDSEGKLIADWVLVATFKMMTLENILLMFAAALLEKPIVVVSRNLSAVSCVAFSMVPLLRPFVWQGLLIPILPRKLSDILGAPVPYIVGIQAADVENVDSVIINLDKNTVKHPQVDLQRLPEAKKLLQNLQPQHYSLRKDAATYNAIDFHNPFTTSPEEYQTAQSILDSLHAYTFWLVSKIRTHYHSSNVDLQVVRNREHLNETFVESVSSYNKEFIKTFLSTQHWSVFSESLADRDAAITPNTP